MEGSESTEKYQINLGDLVGEDEVEGTPHSPVVFLGTTKGRYEQHLQPDGSYQNNDGTLFLAEDIKEAADFARAYQMQHHSDAMLLVARADRLTVRKSPKEKRDYWKTDRLPLGSFVAYNITEDAQRLFDGDEREQAQKLAGLCEPLGVTPDQTKPLLNNS